MEADLEAAVILTDNIVNITSNPEQLEVSAIALTTTLVERLTQTAVQQPEVHRLMRAYCTYY